MSDRNRYEIKDQIGAGAMGIVYRAYDTALDRHIALKVLRSGPDLDDEARERFRREARSGARLNHSNIAVVHDLGEFEGAPYIAMELLEGADLRRCIQERRPLALEQKVRLLAEVCDGLAHAHRLGIIHRDIKPSNIFIHGEEQVKILDFGIARLPSSTLTAGGNILGTPNYMSPEQILCRPSDARSDLFSAAIVSFEFLAYAHPFKSAFIPRRIVESAPDSLYDYLPDIPPQLEQVIQRGLAKEPEDRIQSASEFAAELREVAAVLRVAEVRREEEFNRLTETFDQTLAKDSEAARRALQQMRDLCFSDSRFQYSVASRESLFLDATKMLPRPTLAAAATAGSQGPLPFSQPEREADSVHHSLEQAEYLSESPASGVVRVPPSDPASARETIRRIEDWISGWTTRARRLPPRRKYAALTGICALIAVPVGALVLSRTPVIPVEAPHGQAVSRLTTEILDQPRTIAKRLASLQPGERVNVLQDLKSWRQEWIKVQYVSYDRRHNSPPGYTHLADLSQWSPGLLEPAWASLLASSPPETAPDEQIKTYIGELAAFASRFPSKGSDAYSKQADLQKVLDDRIASIAERSARAEEITKLFGLLKSAWDKGQLTTAMGFSNRILELDPENAEARWWKMRVEQARKILGQG